MTITDNEKASVPQNHAIVYPEQPLIQLFDHDLRVVIDLSEKQLQQLVRSVCPDALL